MVSSVEIVAARLSALAWPMFWQLSVLIVAVGLATHLFCRHRPHLAYVLWLLVLVKALAPPVWSSPASIFSWLSAERRPVAISRVVSTAPTGVQPLWIDLALNDAPGEQPPSVAEALSPTPSARPVVSPAGAILLAWLAGAVALCGVVLRNQWRVMHVLRRQAVEPPAAWTEALAGLRTKLSLQRPVRLVMVDAELGPALVGVWRPRIVVPRSLASLAAHEIEPVLAHELIHLRRRDGLVALAQIAVQVVWWFHPLVYWANRRLRIERERAVDQEVLAALGCEGKQYAHSLLRVLESRLAARQTAIWPGIYRADVTAARIRDIVGVLAPRSAGTPIWCWAVLALLLLGTTPGAGLMLTAAEPQVADESAANGATAHLNIIDAAAIFGKEIDGQLLGVFVADEQQPSPTGVWIPETEGLAASLDQYERFATPAMREAVNKLHEHGGRVTFITREHALEGMPKPPYLSVQLDARWDGKPEALQQLQHLQPKILHIDLSRTEPKSVGHLAGLSDSLERLVLVCASDDVLAELGELTALRSLMLHECAPGQITDAGLKHLAILKNLRELQFQGTFTDQGLAALTALPNLESLQLIGDAHPGPNLDGAWLPEMKRLRVLRTLQTRFTPQGVEQLAQLKNLEQLTLDASLLDDASFEQVGELAELRWLVVTQGKNITARGWSGWPFCKCTIRGSTRSRSWPWAISNR